MAHGILDRSLAPGQKLTRRGMAELTGVSTIAVTEALHRLEAEGLVESRPHMGARVVSLSDEVLRDRYELREAIECHVVRILAARMTHAEASEMKAFARTIDGYAERAETHELFWERHYEFHLRLAAVTGCQSLVDALKKIGLFLILHKTVALVDLAKKNRKEDHVSIVDAIMSRDPATAEDTMRRHVSDFWSVISKRDGTSADPGVH